VLRSDLPLRMSNTAVLISPPLTHLCGSPVVHLTIFDLSFNSVLRPYQVVGVRQETPTLSSFFWPVLGYTARNPAPGRTFHFFMAHFSSGPCSRFSPVGDWFRSHSSPSSQPVNLFLIPPERPPSFFFSPPYPTISPNPVSFVLIFKSVGYFGPVAILFFKKNRS